MRVSIIFRHKEREDFQILLDEALETVKVYGVALKDLHSVYTRPQPCDYNNLIQTQIVFRKGGADSISININHRNNSFNSTGSLRY